MRAGRRLPPPRAGVYSQGSAPRPGAGAGACIRTVRARSRHHVWHRYRTHQPRFRLRRRVPGVPQGVCRRRPRAGAAARDRAVRRRAAAARLRHQRAARRRRAQGPAAVAPRLDRRPRRRGGGGGGRAGRRRAGGAAPAGAAGPRGGHADALCPARRGDGRNGVRRPARGVRPRVRALGGGPRPGDHPRQRQPPGAGADGDRPQLPGEDQRQHRQLGRHLVDRRGSGEAALGDAVGRGYDDGPLDRAGHPRHPRVDPAQLPGARRHGADLPGAGEGGRPAGGADLGDLPRHADRAGRAGRGLLHRPRRRAAALRAHDRAARHRHRLPRRVHPRQVVPGASPRELRLHPLRRDLRDHARLRRLLLAGRRAAARGRSPTPTTRRSSPS